MKSLLRDTSGASIVIALVFFLICGVIGSVVVTAASVQAKSVQTHAGLQQDEYTMQSAAQLVAQQLGGSDATSGERTVTVSVRYEEKKPVIDAADLLGVTSELGKAFWTPARTKAILELPQGGNYVAGASAANRIEIQAPDEASSLATVYGQITVDADLNMIVDLSLDRAMAATSPYNMRVSIPCTPTYNAAGQIIKFTYGDNTIIEKAS